MTEVEERHSTATRRGVLLAAGTLGVGTIVTACGGNEPSSTPTNRASGEATTSRTSASVKASGVPVGGGMIVAEQDIVVTQPQPGQFKAFGATCTHQGCQVSSVSNGRIHCPCHGSQFNITDGSVAHGPAKDPLPAKTVTVTGDALTIT